MKQWTRIIAGWKDETYVSSEDARFVYNIILDFASVEQALNFRETFRGKSYYHYRPKDYPYNYDYKIVTKVHIYHQLHNTLKV